MPLLALPPELRNRIWELALIDPENPVTAPVVSHETKSVHASANIDFTIKKQPATSKPAGVGLLRVNQQIREEALPIYYSGNVFDFNSRRELYRFLRALQPPTKRMMLTQVRINFLPKSGVLGSESTFAVILAAALGPRPSTNSQETQQLEIKRQQTRDQNRDAALTAREELADAGLVIPDNVLEFVTRDALDYYAEATSYHGLVIHSEKRQEYRAVFPIGGSWREQRLAEKRLAGLGGQGYGTRDFKEFCRQYRVDE